MVQPNFSSQEDDVVSLIIQYGNVTDDSEHVLLSHAVPLTVLIWLKRTDCASMKVFKIWSLNPRKRK